MTVQWLHNAAQCCAKIGGLLHLSAKARTADVSTARWAASILLATNTTGNEGCWMRA